MFSGQSHSDGPPPTKPHEPRGKAAKRVWHRFACFWRRGQVEFEDTLLADATQEMNRDSPVQPIVESRAAAELPINGIFRAGDNAGFAAALARSYGLKIEHAQDRIVLSGAPRQ